MKKYNLLYGRIAILFSFITLILLFTFILNLMPESKELITILLIIFGTVSFALTIALATYARFTFEAIEKSFSEMIESIKTGSPIKITHPMLEKLSKHLEELIQANKEFYEEIEQLRRENYEAKDYLSLLSKGEIQSSSLVSTKEISRIALRVENKFVKIFRTILEMVLRIAKFTYHNNKTTYLVEKELLNINTSIESLSTTINELSKLFVILSQKLNEFLSIATESYHNFNKFFEISENLSSLSEEFRKTSTETERINQEMYKEITEIINSTKVISEISEQTLILAMNALIEASKIGEEGKGFVVIADEIRRLSENITQFSKSIINRLQTIKGKSNNLSLSFEKIVEEANSIANSSKDIENLSLKSKTDFTKIIDSTEILSSNINEISYKIYDATEKMKLIPKIIENLLNDMLKSIEINNAEINDILKTTKSKLSQEIKLKSMRIALSLAIADHIIFTNRLTDFIKNNLTIYEEEILDHTKCGLGQWYYSEGISKFGNTTEFKAIEKPHEKFHKLAAEIIKVKEENPEKLEELFLQVIKTSSTIIENLSKLFETLSPEEDSEESI